MSDPGPLKAPPAPLQELICLRAIRDVNVPKFLQEDLKLFSGIVLDLFPTVKEEETDYGILDKAIRQACENSNLKDVDGELPPPSLSGLPGIQGRGAEMGQCCPRVTYARPSVMAGWGSRHAVPGIGQVTDV